MTLPSKPLKELFLSVLEIPVDDRAEWLDRECAGDVGLREQLNRMLAAHDAPHSLFDQPSMIDPTEIRPITEQPGDVIGPYKLLQQIGEGGMGTVFMAEQSEPIERRVALKIIKPGMDTQQVIARFEAERQALAMMDHPNIAKVLDAGATETGRPYFVMELVKGVPITSYCDQQHLSVKERLELFLPVCQAIQHAHQKGIIHRDVKPTNVLVARYDGKPIPKVIDFGVAKATSHRLTEKTMFTKFGQIVGTVEYMSPEQAEFNQLDIDTRSDIYSLGVLLYELLTGETPFDKQRLRSAAFDELLRILREEEPPRPSTRLSSSQSLPTIAANRKSEPGKLSFLVRRELDWVVMKAMEKERERRYETANSLADDLQRYLNDDPVQACPPSAGYKFRKFVRRNKGAVAIALFAAVFVVTVGSGVGWVIRDRAAQRETAAQEQIALQEKADRERIALEEKNRREKQARRDQLASRVEYVLEEVSKHKDSQNWIAVQEAIKRANALLSDSDEFPKLTSQIQRHQRDYDFVRDLENVRFGRGISSSDAESDAERKKIVENDSDQYATLFREFGIDLADLSEEEAGKKIRQHAEIIPVISEALDDWAFLLPMDDEEANRLWRIARAIDDDAWRNDLRNAMIRENSEAIIQLATSDDVLEQSPPTLWLLGESLERFGERELAIVILRKGTLRFPRDFWLNYLTGVLQRRNGDHLEAVPYLAAAHAVRPGQYGAYHGFIDTLSSAGLHDEAIERWQHLIDNDRAGLWPHRGIALAYSRSGRHQQAIVHAEKVLKGNPRESWVPIHQGLLASEYKKLGRWKESLVWYEKQIRMSLELGEGDSYDLCFKLIKFAEAQTASGADSLGRLREFATEYPDSSALQCAIANVLYGSAEWDQARNAYLDALKIDADSALAHHGLGMTLMRLNRYDEAIEHYRTAIELWPETGAISKNRANSINNIGWVLIRKKDYAAAATEHRNAIAIDPDKPLFHENLGLALQFSGDDPGAAVAYREAVRLYGEQFENETSTNEAKRRLAANLIYLARVLATSDDPEVHNPEEAVALARRAVELFPDSSHYWHNLGLWLIRAGRFEEAQHVFRTAIVFTPDKAFHYVYLGDALFLNEQFLEAERAYRAGLNLLTAADGSQAQLISQCYFGLCSVLLRLGKPLEAVELVRGTDHVSPEFDALLHNQVAWFLATAEDELLREATEAVSLARQAIKLDSDNAGYWNTLGVAHYRAGQWKDSISALEESMQRTEGGTAFDWFFLAMAHWQLGEKELAQGWCERAVEWMEKHQPENEELLRFRAETERLFSGNDKEQNEKPAEEMNQQQTGR